MTRPNNGGDKARVVITVPRRPSQFESALAEIPDSGVLIETHEAFLHLSRLARARLVLVSPFLDEAGARWAISMFEATPAPERVLLCRNVSAFDDLPMDCKQALETLGVQIRTYALIHEKDGRYVGRESFHAKIVLADQVAARPRSSKGSSSSQSFCSAYVRRPQAHGSIFRSATCSRTPIFTALTNCGPPARPRWSATMMTMTGKPALRELRGHRQQIGKSAALTVGALDDPVARGSSRLYGCGRRVPRSHGRNERARTSPFSSTGNTMAYSLCN